MYNEFQALKLILGADFDASPRQRTVEGGISNKHSRTWTCPYGSNGI